MAKNTRQLLKDVIAQILRKRGKTVETLSTEVAFGHKESEKQMYERWQRTLEKGPITLDEFLDAIRAEIGRAQSQLECVDVKLNDRDDIWLKMSLRFNRLYLSLFTEPDQAKEWLASKLKREHNL